MRTKCDNGLDCRLRPGECRKDSDAYGACLSTPAICLFPGPRVCGCDGVTYASSCLAFKNGTNIAEFADCDGTPDAPAPFYHGNPVTPHEPRAVPVSRQACSINTACPKHQYCEYLHCGERAGDGWCVNIPKICPVPDGGSVCGCDGKTYESICYAARGMVAVRHRGSCAPSPSNAGPGVPLDYPAVTIGSQCGLVNDNYVPCNDSAYSCVGANPPFGTCDGNRATVCVRVEEYTACPYGTGRVCGCDGFTYENLCEAWHSGVEAEHDGDCSGPPPPYRQPAAPLPVPGQQPASGTPCDSTDECAYGSYCQKADGDCDSVGVCAPKPGGCSSSASDRVCGCDGVTYASKCDAALRNGESVAMEGVCYEATGDDCDSDVDCDAGQFCNVDYTDCGASLIDGTCAVVPTECPASAPDDWSCGCNGKMYRTPCDAAMARMSLTTYNVCSARPLE